MDKNETYGGWQSTPITDVHENAEGHSQCDPEHGPAQGLPDGNDMGLAVEHAEVQRQQQQNQAEDRKSVV